MRIRLSHAEQGTTTELHPVPAYEPTGLCSLLPPVRRHDRRKERAGRLDIVVVAMHPTLGQPAGLLFFEHTRADCNLQTRFLAHERDQLENPREKALVGTANGQDDTEFGGAEIGRLASGAQDFSGVEERRGFHRGLEAGRLRAEMAVLRASPGLCRQNALDLDGRTATRQAHLVGKCCQARDRAVREGGETAELFGFEQTALVEQRRLGCRKDGSLSGAQWLKWGIGRRGPPCCSGAEGDRAALGRVLLRVGHGPTVVGRRGNGANRGVVHWFEREGKIMAWDFSTEPEFEVELEWMRGFVRDEVFPFETLDLTYDQVLKVVAPLQEQVRERGLWAAHLPHELGGMGFGQVRLGLMHEILGQSPYAPVVFGNNAPDSGNAEMLAVGIKASGREDQRARWLQPLLDGKLRSGFSMTEPNTAGSDPTLLSTRATRDGDEYVINGHKWFTTNGSVADFLIVMAVTNPDVHPYQGSSMILVPADTPGVEIVRDVASMEDPDAPFGRFGNHAEIRYDDVRVPVENLIGLEGEGFQLAQARLGPGRIHHCMRWLGQSKRALDMLCERAVSRYAHGSLLAEKQTVQNWVADSMAEMSAARLMTLHAAWTIDRHGAAAARVEIAMIKYFGAKVLYDVIDRAIQVHGSLGFSCDLPLEAMYRAARAARIYDGPDEVHRATVARRTLRGYTPAEIPTEHIPTRRQAAREKFAEVLDGLALND